MSVADVAIGDRVRALDREGVWYDARVVMLRSHKCKVHFDGWSSLYDEWIEFCSDRLYKRTSDGNDNDSEEVLPAVLNFECAVALSDIMLT